MLVVDALEDGAELADAIEAATDLVEDESAESDVRAGCPPSTKV